MRVPFQISSEGKELLGIFHIANEQLNIPVVIIMCYGLNGNRVEQHRMSIKLGDLCEQNKINLVRFDYVNVGISEGNFFYTNLSERIQNVIDVYTFVKGCMNKRVFVYLIGFSDGAKIAAGVKPYIYDLKGIIFWNPIVNVPQEFIEDEILPVTRYKLKIHKKFKMPYKQLFGVCLNTTILKEMEADDSVYEFDDTVGMLFVFGEKDKFSKNCRIYLEKRKMNNSNIRIVNQAGHLFCHTKYEKQVLKYSIDWIQRSLQGG